MNLKQIREKAGLTQKQLAEHLGFESAQFISNIERGISQMPVKQFKKAASKLGMSPILFVDNYIAHKRTKILNDLRLK